MRNTLRKIAKLKLVTDGVELYNDYAKDDELFSCYYNKKTEMMYAVEESNCKSIFVYKLKKPMSVIKELHENEIMTNGFGSTWKSEENLKLTPRDVFMLSDHFKLMKIEFKIAKQIYTILIILELDFMEIQNEVL